MSEIESILRRVYRERLTRTKEALSLPNSLTEKIGSEGLAPQKWFEKYNQLAMGVYCGAIEMRSKQNPNETLSINDIEPYPGGSPKEEGKIVVFLKGAEAYELGIFNDHNAIKNWMRRVVSLGLRADSLEFGEVEEI